MKPSNGITVLDISVTVMNAPAMIHPVLIQDEKTNILIDSTRDIRAIRRLNS